MLNGFHFDFLFWNYFRIRTFMPPSILMQWRWCWFLGSWARERVLKGPGSVRSFLHVLCLSPTFAQVTVNSIFEPFYDGSPWYRHIGMWLARWSLFIKTFAMMTVCVEKATANGFWSWNLVFGTSRLNKVELLTLDWFVFVDSCQSLMTMETSMSGAGRKGHEGQFFLQLFYPGEITWIWVQRYGERYFVASAGRKFSLLGLFSLLLPTPFCK